MKFNVNQYELDIFSIDSFKPESIDSDLYINNYLPYSDYRCTTIIGINIYENCKFLTSAIIGANGGGTDIHKTSQVIEDDRLLVCCNEMIFCLSIPELKLLWKTKADFITCFEIYKINDFYIVHGELEISRLNQYGNIIWQNSGAEIFVTENDVDDFEITESYIQAEDWNSNIYQFDFDGNLIEDTILKKPAKSGFLNQ